jgi:hypothetical protein
VFLFNFALPALRTTGRQDDRTTVSWLCEYDAGCERSGDVTTIKISSWYYLNIFIQEMSHYIHHMLKHVIHILCIKICLNDSYIKKLLLISLPKTSFNYSMIKSRLTKCWSDKQFLILLHIKTQNFILCRQFYLFAIPRCNHIRLAFNLLNPSRSVCASCFNMIKKNSAFSPQNIFVCFVYFSRKASLFWRGLAGWPLWQKGNVFPVMY